MRLLDAVDLIRIMETRDLFLLVAVVRNAAAVTVIAVGQELARMVILTRSPFGLGRRSISRSKSMADMMPSPNSSWISSFQVVP